MSKCDHAYIYNNIRMSTVDDDGYCNMCGEYIPESERFPKRLIRYSPHIWFDPSNPKSRYIVPPSITGGTSEER